MSKKTWILISCLVLSLTLGLGGSLAYLTDTDTRVNTFTMGNVDITLEEPNGQQYDIMPGTTAKDKVAYIKNNGSNAAYVWMTVAVPHAMADYVWPEFAAPDANYGGQLWGYDDENGRQLATENKAGIEGWWNCYDAFDEARRGYRVYTYICHNALGVGDNTINILEGVTMDGRVTLIDGMYYEVVNGDKRMLCAQDDLEVIVTGHAIQADGIGDWQQAYTSYTGQWGDMVIDTEAESKGKTYTSSATVNEYIVLPDNDENSDCITATGEDTVVVINGGKYDIGTNYNPCAVWAKEGATVEIHDGEFLCDARDDLSATKHIDLIYAGSGPKGSETKGTILIYGGRFGAEGSTPGNPGAWLLNEKDGYGEIIVMGGDFLNWNPAGNTSEGNPTNFVPEEGYEVWIDQQGEEQWYCVRPSDDPILVYWAAEGKIQVYPVPNP